MKRLFQLMADKKASDIFLSVGAPINIKINGVAMPVNQTLLTPTRSRRCSTRCCTRSRSANTKTRWN